LIAACSRKKSDRKSPTKKPSTAKKQSGQIMGKAVYPPASERSLEKLLG